MNRYIVTLATPTGTRKVIIAAEGIIDARVRADHKCSRGEKVVSAAPYDPSITVA